MGTDQEVELFKRYYEVCTDLNLDKAATDEAWQSFQRISINYTLEGDKLHWLACALYVSCRRGVTPTVGGGRGSYIEGNCVSLTRLLRSCKLSLVQFFNKMKKWSDMASLSHEMRDKIDHLERNFAVTTVIFNKFKPIFSSVFQEPVTSPAKPKSKKAAKKLTITSNEVFSFCWTLYVSVRSSWSVITDDLVNSYHLLLAAIDFCYANALVSDFGKELLNPEFSQLPPDFQTTDFRNVESVPCIVPALCTAYDGIYVEAAGIKEHWWRPAIQRMIEKKTLRCVQAGEFLGFFDSPHFEFNLKSANRDYEQYVLNLGDLDERVFLCENADQELGIPEASANQEFDERMNQKQLMKQHMEETKSLMPMTPLSNRHFLKKDSIPVTPVSSATQMVSKLHSLLIDRSDKPSEALDKLFTECSNNPREEIATRVAEMGGKFVAAYAQHYEQQDQEQVPAETSLTKDFAKKRLELAVTLYYKSLENIMNREKKRLQTQSVEKIGEQLTALLTREVFHVALFALCVEVVLFSYNSKRTFPWTVEVFKDFRNMNFQPFHFYRVIEIFIREEDGLSRSVVKHLNVIEEQILESVAWQSNSALWDAIDAQGVPSCQDVSLPTPDGVPTTPISSIRRFNRDPFASPNITSAAIDRFASPTPVRRRLAFDGNPPGSQNGQNEQVIISLQTQGANGEVRTVQVPAYILPANPEVKPSEPPRKTGPLGLFFRKVYNLAFLRMRDLYDRLNITDEELKRKIWTCFELSLKDHSNLLKDRHLDQLIMCAIYAMCKVTRNDKAFTDIMKNYRLQPQAHSHIYRNVLLERILVRQNSISSDSKSSNGSTEDSAKSIRSSSVLPAPTQSPTPSKLQTENGDSYGDIIMFYNQVYVPEMKNFIVRFSMTSESPLLSPLPRLAAPPVSPYRRISHRHSVFVSPMKAPGFPSSPGRPLSYSFMRSPAKDLTKINQMMKMNERKTVSKRIFQDDDGISDQSKRMCTEPPVFRTKMQSIVSEQSSH